MGSCLGGTLFARTLAYMVPTDSARTNNQVEEHIGDHLSAQPAPWAGATRVVSATYLAAPVDFSSPGDIRAYLNPHAVNALSRQMESVGYLDGRIMGDTFSAMRANDLIWHFFVNNYLCGRAPQSFDLLYWNADVTNMPRAMHCFFLTELYQRDRLRVAGGIVLAGRPGLGPCPDYDTQLHSCDSR
jgi:polyhydroxyalkanoate synthase